MCSSSTHEPGSCSTFQGLYRIDRQYDNLQQGCRGMIRSSCHLPTAAAGPDNSYSSQYFRGRERPPMTTTSNTQLLSARLEYDLARSVNNLLLFALTSPTVLRISLSASSRAHNQATSPAISSGPASLRQHSSPTQTWIQLHKPKPPLPAQQPPPKPPNCPP